MLQQLPSGSCRGTQYCGIEPCLRKGVPAISKPYLNWALATWLSPGSSLQAPSYLHVSSRLKGLCITERVSTELASAARLEQSLYFTPAHGQGGRMEWEAGQMSSHQQLLSRPPTWKSSKAAQRRFHLLLVGSTNINNTVWPMLSKAAVGSKGILILQYSAVCTECLRRRS